MRVAVIVIGIAMVSTPSYASKSCMSLAEARQQLGQVHLYWHGDHCWDASTGHHGFVHRTRHGDLNVKQAQRDNDEDDAEEKTQAPKWRDARDAMPQTSAADAPVFRSAATVFRSADAAPASIAQQSNAPSPGLNWPDRWVEIIQVFPRIQDSHAVPPVARPAKFEPLVTPVRVILAFLAIVLTIGVIEILFRSTIHEYRK